MSLPREAMLKELLVSLQRKVPGVVMFQGFLDVQRYIRGQGCFTAEIIGPTARSVAAFSGWRRGFS